MSDFLLRRAFSIGWVAWVDGQPCDPPSDADATHTAAFRAGWAHAADRNAQSIDGVTAACAAYFVNQYADRLAAEHVAILTLLDVCHAYKNGSAPPQSPDRNPRGGRVHRDPASRHRSGHASPPRAPVSRVRRDRPRATSRRLPRFGSRHRGRCRVHQIKIIAEDLRAERAQVHAAQEKV